MPHFKLVHTSFDPQITSSSLVQKKLRFSGWSEIPSPQPALLHRGGAVFCEQSHLEKAE